MLRVARISSVRWIDRLKTMVEQPSKLSLFLAELRRRHVFRVAVGYAAFAFVVLQLGEIVLPAFSAEWALQLVVVFTILGFPVVMALAWVFDVTSDGIRATAALDQDANRPTPSTGILPRLALLAVTLLAVGGVGSWWVLNTVQRTDTLAIPRGPSVLSAVYDPDEPIRSLAVLPLQNFSENAGQDYFAAGMHEALIEHLSQLPEIRVVSRTSVARYSGTDQTIPEIAQELGVEALVEGSVIRADDEVRITVQLIHGPSDTHFWTRSYDRTFANVLALQREVAGAIAEEIGSELSIDGGPPVVASDGGTTLSSASGSDVPAANEAFMRARYEQFSETPDGLLAARDHFSEAVAADPAFAAAYAGLAGTELMLGMSPQASDRDRAESLGRARVFALKAFEMDPELPEAHDILALIEEQLSEERLASPAGIDAPEPVTEVRLVRNAPTTADGVDGGAFAGDSITVISVDPSLVSSAAEFRRDSTSIAESFTQVGRQLRAASADWASQSGRLASMEPAQLVGAALQLKAAERPRAAIEVLRTLAERSPGHAEAWDALELLYVSANQYEELLAMRRQWVETAEGDAESVDRLEERLRNDGAEGYWEWRLDHLQERASEGEAVSPVYLAAAQVALGETDAAVASLRDAVRVRDRRLMPSLRTDPVWDILRSDPRFSSLVREIASARPGRGGRGQSTGGRRGNRGPAQELN